MRLVIQLFERHSIIDVFLYSHTDCGTHVDPIVALIFLAALDASPVLVVEPVAAGLESLLHLVARVLTTASLVDVELPPAAR